MPIEKVTIAPLVLLSVVDHYKRVSVPRVIGVLMGSSNDTVISITNSFAVPFEESEDNFFFDTSYLQNMFELFYKVNCAESVVGWYHSGPKMHQNDLEISKAFNKYCSNPVMAIVDVEMKASDIPVQVFQLKGMRQLEHLNVQVGADETEEVGVEHLLRDIKEGTGCSMVDRIEEIKDSLRMYRNSLGEIIQYVDDIQNGKEPSLEVLELFQEILNEVPKITEHIDMSRIYSLELTNTLVMMNDFLRNKIENEP
ncbi:26S proteasome non-ATPase regulatory subunit 7 [Glugoides intestinalis]